MKQRAAELRRKSRKKTTPEEDAAEVVATIAAMEGSDREIAERLHAIILAAAPGLAPKTWYGFPSYAKDGTRILSSSPPESSRPATRPWVSTTAATLDDGEMWPSSFAITAITPEVEARITELVRRATA